MNKFKKVICYLFGHRTSTGSPAKVVRETSYATIHEWVCPGCNCKAYGLQLKPKLKKLPL